MPSDYDARIAMNSQTNHPVLLRRGGLMRIDAHAGDRIACLRGMVWLTQEGDPQDWILSAGETFVCDRAGLVVVNALAHDAVLEYPHAERLRISTPARLHDKSAMTLAAEIGRIKARITPQSLATMPIGPRREAVEREARRMRGQVTWLVWQHARRALAQAFTRCAALLRPTARSATHPAARKSGRRAEAG